AVDVLLLTVGALDTEGRGLLAEFECDVGHESTVPGGGRAAQADAATRAQSRRGGWGCEGSAPPPRAPPRSVARVTAPRPNRAVASSRAPSTRRHSASSSQSVGAAAPVARSFSALTPTRRTGSRRSTAPNRSSAASPI